jgi:hypothetical protein
MRLSSRGAIGCAALVAITVASSPAFAQAPPPAAPPPPAPQLMPPPGIPFSGWQATRTGYPPGVFPGPVADEPAKRWGLHSGDSVPKGDWLVYLEVGWPDLVTGFQRGVTDSLDVGFRASVGFGVDYVIPRGRQGVNDISLGLGLTAPVRWMVARTDRVSVLVHADPGLKFDYLTDEPRNAAPFFGPQIPLGIDLGIHVGERGTLTLGVDVPLIFRVTPDPTMLVALLAGLTYEHRFRDTFGMSFNLRPGILHGFNATGNSTDLALLGQIGFLWHR